MSTLVGPRSDCANARVENPSRTTTIKQMALARTLLLIFIRIPPKDSYEYDFDKNRNFCGADTETPFPVRTNCTANRGVIKLWREGYPLLLQCDTEHDSGAVFQFYALVGGVKHAAIYAIHRRGGESDALKSDSSGRAFIQFGATATHAAVSVQLIRGYACAG